MTGMLNNICTADLGGYTMILLGKDPATKADEFLEKFQMAFDPPPSFLENYIANLFIMDMVAFMQGGIGQTVSVNIS